MAVSDSPPAAEAERIEVVDVPIHDLVPILKRTVRKGIFARLEANIRAVGLIEPLLVHPGKGCHFILDGYLRYQVLLALGVTTAPCLVVASLDLYTPNRQVNYISMSQRWRMLKAASRVVDEATLKSALGIAQLRHELSPSQQADLCAEVKNRVRDDRLSKTAAEHLVHVTQERQTEILAAMDQANDQSIAFIRAQILRTAPEQRVIRPGRTGPWDRAAATKKKLADRLTDAERHADFFQGLYRQYANDLFRLAVHVRNLMAHRELREHLSKHHPEAAKLFKQVVQQSAENVESR